MSLHFIGIRDFPVLHQQFSSPTSKNPESPSLNREVSGDNKDVLIQRMNDLISRLLQEEELRDEDIAALHVDVDRMERVMRRTTGKGLEDSPKSPVSMRWSTMSTSRDQEEDPFWPPASPRSPARMRIPQPSLQISHSTLQGALDLAEPRSLEVVAERQAQQNMNEHVNRLANEAELLQKELSDALMELRARKEEVVHIRDILVTRAEKAAQRILELEPQLQTAQADFESTQSEMTHLRIQLDAIKVQCSAYIESNVDTELTDSIRKWELEWADVDQRSKARRKRSKDSIASMDGARTPSRSRAEFMVK